MPSHTLSFGPFTFQTQAASAQPVESGFLLSGAQVSVLVDQPVRAVYQHGWQSWSLAAWTPPQSLPVQQPVIHHPMQIDPVYAHHPAPHGSGLLALELEDGQILLLGALGLESHAQWRQGALSGWVETGVDSQWVVLLGSETQVFNDYAKFLAKTLGAAPAQKTQRVWCSWYSFYTTITEEFIHRALQDLEGYEFDVFQVDDGWQERVGDWQPNTKFPAGMSDLAQRIHASGRKAGLWLAPFIALPSSRLFQQHPDWFLRTEDGGYAKAGFNWGESLMALDTSHPEALAWLTGLMKQVRAWGYDYVKLDFLYAAALPGKRFANLGREAAYRQGLQTLRQALGDAYLLTCGAPVLPSLGLCDAMRVSTDVSGEWETYRDAVLWQNPTTGGTRNALRSTLHRLWLAPLVHPDPDVAYFRSEESHLSPQQRQLLQDIAEITRFKATSDLPMWMTEAEKTALKRFWREDAAIQQEGRYVFTLNGRRSDFSAAVPLPPAPRGMTALWAQIYGWLSSQPAVMRSGYAQWQKELQQMTGRMLR